MALIAEETVDVDACCCSCSQNFYNILCCRRSDDQAGHEIDNDGDQAEVHIGERETGQEEMADVGVDIEEPEELNLGAWNLVVSYVEEVFYQMAFGDDEYEISSYEDEHVDDVDRDEKTIENVVTDTMGESTGNPHEDNAEMNEEQLEREQR